MNMLNFSQPTPPEQVGVNPAALRRLQNLFQRQIEQGLHPAAQMVVAKDGQVLFDQTAGDFNHGKPVMAETPFYCFSASKAFTGICVFKLIEEGKVSLDAAVADYWPEFGRHGKAEITIRQVFHHLAGIPVITRYRQIPLWPFWRLVTADIARLTPEFPPGSKMIYHPLSWGFILGEVIRRVTGMRFETYFDQNLAQPLGLQNSWFRLPSQRLKDSPKIISGHSDQNALAMLFNFRPIRRSVLPAGSLHSTAREMAVFYQMLINGGSYGGSKILKPETVSQAVSSGYRGWDEHFQRDSLWAYGFHLGGWKSSGSGGAVESVFGGRSTSSTFGHTGNRSTLAWGDTTHNLVMTFTCNRLLGSQEARQRWIDLSNAVWDLISV